MDILIALELYDDAQRYARICYECLTRPVDTKSLEVAESAQSLGHGILRILSSGSNEGGYIIEAEMLVRKAISIKSKLFIRDHPYILHHLQTLSEILQYKNENGDHDQEVQGLYERCLAMCTEYDINVFGANKQLFVLHRKLYNSSPPREA